MQVKKIYKDKQGRFHREHGPAIIYDDGSKEWWQNDRRHRIDLPAIERSDGGKFWFQNGVKHREDGPASEHPDGHKEYYLHGYLLNNNECFKSLLKSTTSDNIALLIYKSKILPKTNNSTC